MLHGMLPLFSSVSPRPSLPPLACPQVDGLEQELAQQDPVPLLGELESCQARLRQAQAACGSKEAALRELRERLEQQTRCGRGWAGLGWPCSSIARVPYLRLLPLCRATRRRLAHQQGVLEERETQQAAVRQLSQQLAEREAHVQELHSQLKQMHSELSAASDGLQATAASHTAAAEGAAARLEAAGRCAQQLMAAVRLLLEMLEELGAAVAAAADREACDAQVGRRQPAGCSGTCSNALDFYAASLSTSPGHSVPSRRDTPRPMLAGGRQRDCGGSRQHRGRGGPGARRHPLGADAP